MAADLVELRMNVAAVKRVDPYIKDILGTATQVALYSFSALKNEWEKTDVEGALFVCSRNGEPYNSILIMNRLNTNNLVEPIVKDLDWQMQAPFLLYRNPRNNIFGIWFYNRDDCVKTTFLLENIMESLNNNHLEKPRKSTADADIFSMLSKAKENFQKTPAKNENQNQSQPQSSTPRIPDVTSQSVMDFFAKASTTKTQPAPTRIASNEKHSMTPILHRLMSNPVHSVEHIEKQQRAVTPQDVNTSNNIVRTKIVLNKQTPSKISGFTVLKSSTNPVESRSSQIDSGINFLRIASPLRTSPRTFLKQAFSDEPEPRTLTSPVISLLENHQKPALMPPMMFTSTGISTKEKNDSIVPEPLTVKQLQQALQYLFRNDPEFVTKIHEAYVNSLKEMFS